MQTKIEEMFKAGAHYGYSKSRRHPSTSGYIFATKNGVDIINIEKAYDLFEAALAEVTRLAATGKTILFVGTKAEAQQQTIETALSLNMPYVSMRWVGGSLTNYPEIKRRITKLLDLRKQKEEGGLDKYTKKERLLIDREMDDMTNNFQGLTGMTRIPDAVFVVDPKKEHIAVTEAKKMNLPVISLLNTDCNLKQVEFPIVANDASVSSITYFLAAVKEAYNQGLTGAKK
jgi:small subunit ribosomal protein S2